MPMSPRLFFRSYVEVTYHISHWQYFANVCRPCAQNVGTAWMTRDWQLYCALPLQNAAFWRFQKSRGLHLPVAKFLFLNSKGQSCYPYDLWWFCCRFDPAHWQRLHIDRDVWWVLRESMFHRSNIQWRHHNTTTFKNFKYATGHQKNTCGWAASWLRNAFGFSNVEPSWICWTTI